MTPLHICHITTVHPAMDARIYHRMCRALAARGHRVTLIAPGRPDEGDVQPSGWNLEMLRVGRVKRLRYAYTAARELRADVYHFHDPELIPVGLALRARGYSVVYDVHEDYPSMMRVKYWIPPRLRGLVAWTMQGVHALAGAVLQGIVTADPGVLNDFGRARARTMVYYNFPDLALFPATDPPVPPSVDLVYVGGMSQRSGFFVVLDALCRLREQGRDVTAHFAGYTDGEGGLAEVHRGVRTRGLSGQVLVTGRIPHTAVPAWMQRGRIGLVTLQPIAKFMKNIPSKLFEYWACGLPVIASDLPPIRPFMARGGGGRLVDPTDADALAQAIAWMLDHPAEAAAMGRAGREQVQTVWNNETQVTQLLALYESLAVDARARERRGGCLSERLLSRLSTLWATLSDEVSRVGWWVAWLCLKGRR